MKKFISAVLLVCAICFCVTVSACTKDENKITSYEIFCIYDEDAGKLTGTVTVDYYNCTDTEISDLKFNLYGNAFRKDAA